jgi:hypothetical protein
LVEIGIARRFADFALNQSAVATERRPESTARELPAQLGHSGCATRPGDRRRVTKAHTNAFKYALVGCSVLGETSLRPLAEVEGRSLVIGDETTIAAGA